MLNVHFRKTILNKNHLELFTKFPHFQSFYLLELSLTKASAVEMGA